MLATILALFRGNTAPPAPVWDESLNHPPKGEGWLTWDYDSPVMYSGARDLPIEVWSRFGVRTITLNDLRPESAAVNYWRKTGIWNEARPFRTQQSYSAMMANNALSSQYAGLASAYAPANHGYLNSLTAQYKGNTCSL